MMRKRRWVVFERFFIAPLRLLTALLFAFSTLSVPVTVTHAQDDLATALAEVQAATTITGTLDNLVANFNLVIPEVVVTAGYQINSLITLSAPLPAGSLVTITRDGGAYVTDAVFEGTEHWITDLMGYPLTVSAPFDHSYDYHTETYVISVSGNTEPIDIDITIKSIISPDVFATERVVLAETTLDLIQDIDGLAEALAEVQAATTITGTLDNLVANFNLIIPEVVVTAGYQINSLITLSAPLPTGSRVTITRDGWPYVTDAVFEGTEQWITDLMGYPLTVSAPFDHSYDNQTETYVITVSGNTEPIDVDITIQSIISRDLFVAEEVILAEITLDLVQDVLDEDLALAYVQANTSLTGTLDNLVAQFDLVIPDVVATAGYRINSLITLSAPLPTGSRVTITRDGSAYVTDAEFDGTSKWITDLMGLTLEYSAPFDHSYDNHSETYVITISGNTEPIDVDITIQSIISGDLFDSEQIVLAEITLELVQDILDENLALAYVQSNTTLSGTLAELTATFPLDIPDVIVNDIYEINSRMTLGQALPAGSTVSILISVNGSDYVPYVTDATIPGTVFWVTDLLPAITPPEDFNENYSSRVEVYAITINPAESAEEFDTTVKIESIISKDEFATPVILADITLPIHVDDTIPPVLDITGMTADGETMTGNLESGYILETTGDPHEDHLIQFAAGTSASEILGSSYFEFFLTSSTVTALELEAYYTARGVPEPYLSYLIAAANGTNPFVLIKGDTVTLVDAAKYAIQKVDVDFTVPDDFPTGTYTAQGKVVDLYGNESTVTLKLIVERIPSFSVNPDDDTVHGWFWPAGITVTLTAHETDFQQIVGSNGEVDFPDLGIDLVVGDAVILTGGETVKTHIIEQIEFSGYDLTADMITGTAGAGRLVSAWACDSTQCFYVEALANSSGVWMVNFNGILDLVPGSTGGAQVIDTDNDNTRINWRIPEAYIWVYPDPDLNYIRGVGWNPGSEVFLLIEHEAQGMRIAGSDGVVQFSALAPELEAGMVVELTDGITTRTHTIIDLAVTAVDQEAETVSGTSDSLGRVESYVYVEEQPHWVDATFIEPGSWIATYSVDITSNVYGGVRQYDEQGNSTRIYWEISNPYLIVDPHLDTVNGINWRKNSPIDLTINSSIDEELYTSSAVSDEYGLVEFDLVGLINIQPGMEVILEDGFSSKGHYVFDLTVTLVDEDTDEISGTASPGSKVSITAFTGEPPGIGVDVNADASGAWFVDFTGIVDIVVGTSGYAEQKDADGNRTRINYMVVNEVPVLSSLSPTFTTIGSQAITLYVDGEHFSEGYSVVRWNGEERPTNFISQTQLSIQLSPEDLDTAGTAMVEVYTSEPGGGLSAKSIDFPIIDFSPANGAKLALTTVFFSWDSIPGATKYKIELYSDSALTKPVFSAKTNLLVYAYLTPLVDGKTYYWRIQPMYAGVWSGEWSPVLYFYSRNPPAAPNLASPLSKTATYEKIVTLTWDPAERGEYYLLQVATDSLFVNKVLKETLLTGEMTKVLNFEDPNLGQGKYYWRVRAFDEVNVKGPWSEVWSLKVDWTPPAKPLLYIPLDGAVKDKVPTFRWFAATGAKTYVFEYREKEAGDWLPSIPMTLLYYKPTSIIESGTYEWHVCAFDKALNENCSDPRTITINLP